MKNRRARLIAWSCLLALPLFSTAAFSMTSATSSSSPTPRQKAEAQEENAGYGYRLEDGTPSLELDTAAVFAPDQAIIVVDTTNEKNRPGHFQGAGSGRRNLEHPRS